MSSRTAEYIQDHHVMSVNPKCEVTKIWEVHSDEIAYSSKKLGLSWVSHNDEA